MSDIYDIIPKKQLAKFLSDQRREIAGYLRKYHGASDEDIADAFQEGCHVLLRDIQSGKFSVDSADYSLTKYLQTCCRNHLLKIYAKRKKSVRYAENTPGNDGEGASDAVESQDGEAAELSANESEEASSESGSHIIETEEDDKINIEEQEDKSGGGIYTPMRERYYQLMESILADLPEPCKDLIYGKYWDGFSAAEMAYRLDYNSDRVAITTLSRCMGKLRKRFNNERRLIDEQ